MMTGGMVTIFLGGFHVWNAGNDVETALTFVVVTCETQ